MKFIFHFLVSCLFWQAAASADDSLPLWEYGIGLGFIRYEQYPASNQTSDLFLPFPTFQYRGKILRADDREGTRAYLFKSPRWTLEMSGGLYPALDSNDNEARRGMGDLPWMLRLGPQAIYRINESFEFRLGLFQAVSSDLKTTHLAGQTLEGQARYRWQQDSTHGNLTFTVRSANKEFLSTYFEVPQSQATADRPTYDARGGFLSDELGYFQSFNSGHASLYLGGSLSDYSISSNRESPLHKSDRNLTFFAGLTYVLGESERNSVSEQETQGLINRYQKYK